MRVVCVALLLLALTVQPATAQQWTVENTLEAIEAVAPQYREWIRETVRCETGGTFNPMVTNWNDSGYGPSRGPAQINDYWQGAHFHASGYTDPYNPYEAIPYLENAFRGDYVADGIGWWRWSCA